MKKLFFDIETIPCNDDLKEIYISLKRKGATEEFTEQQIEDLFLNTSFDGAFGRICCIGYVKEDGMLSQGVLKGDEKEMLKEFWNIARDVQLFIGHNIYDFDFPFVYQRSMINGIRPRQDLSFARYRKIPIFDTMKEWTIWNQESRNKKSLDTLAKVFGLKSSKENMDGSQVWPYYKSGKIDEICNYCMRDVEVTRQVYYKMIVEDMPFQKIVEPVYVQDDIPF